MISIILIDKRKSALIKLKDLLECYDFITVIGMHINPMEAIHQINENPPDAVFLDVDFKQASGIDTAKLVKNINHSIEIVFVTKLHLHAVQAFELNALDYIIKPVKKERLDNTVSRLLVKHRKNDKKIVYDNSIFIQCFGKFFICNKNDNKKNQFKWRTKKEKELFAYLVCNYDKAISKEDIATILYNGVDRKKAYNNIYVTMSYLRKSLKEYDVVRNSILIRGDYSLYIEEGICDYVDFDRYFKKISYIDQNNVFEIERRLQLYQGLLFVEEEYAWAQEVQQYLDVKYEKILFLLAYYYKDNRMNRNYERTLLHILHNNSISIEAMQQLMEFYIEYNKINLFRKQYLAYEEVLSLEFDENPLLRYREHYENLE